VVYAVTTATERIDARITQTSERYNNIIKSGYNDDDVNQGTFEHYIIIIIITIIVVVVVVVVVIIIIVIVIILLY